MIIQYHLTFLLFFPWHEFKSHGLVHREGWGPVLNDLIVACFHLSV
jgi:hypothetical protein